MDNVTFEHLPKAVNQLSAEVKEIKAILLANITKPTQEDEWLDVKKLMEYLPDKPKRPTIYSWVNKKLIPYHKRGKHLRFLKSEVNQWLLRGKVDTSEEYQEKIAAERDAYLSTRRKSR